MKHLALALALAPALALTACGGAPVEDSVAYVRGEKGSSFKEPNIKNDFCGVHINYQYCKCAFHGDYCDSIGMDEDGADAYVQSEFDAYVQELLDAFTTTCSGLNGYVDGGTCYVCPVNATPDGRRCRVEEVEGTDSEEGTEGTEVVEGCEVDEGDWEKYSDIDWRIPTDERSFEAKNYARAQDEIVKTYAKQAELVYETDLLRQQLADLKDYKAALVDNLRDNLVKATLRLAYVTYSQVKGAKGAGESFSKVFTSTESLEVLGAGMKSVQAVVPKGSRLEIDSSTAAGKVKSIGWNATLEAIESMGDPSKIAQQVMKDSKGALVPSADITPEEVEILRQQNLENNLLDQAMAEIEAQIASNEMWLSVADSRIQDLEAESAKWLAAEKARTLLLLKEDCTE